MIISGQNRKKTPFISWIILFHFKDMFEPNLGKPIQIILNYLQFKLEVSKVQLWTIAHF